MPGKIFYSKLVFIVLFVGSISYAYRGTSDLNPDELRSFGGLGKLGVEYNEGGFFEHNTCVLGKVDRKLRVVEPQTPFAQPVVFRKTNGGSLVVAVSVVTSARLVKSLSGPLTIVRYGGINKTQKCGQNSYFISEIEVGARIFVSRTIAAGKNSQAKLYQILKTRVTDLSTLVNLDLSNDKLEVVGNGDLELRGRGRTRALESKFGACIHRQGCEDFINQAYTDAESLDERYPAVRVRNLQNYEDNFDSDIGDSIMYGIQKY